MAGGQGSRLRPLTLTRPKPMVEVLGRPVIDFVKDAMVDAGVEHLVVTTGYQRGATVCPRRTVVHS